MLWGLREHLRSPLVVRVVGEPGDPKVFSEHTAHLALPVAASVFDQAGRAGLSTARIARDCGLCLLPNAHRASGIGRDQLSTGEGRQRGASHTGFPGPAGLGEGLPLRPGAPRAACCPDTRRDAAFRLPAS